MFRRSALALVVFFAVPAAALWPLPAHAALCVWRKPDEDIRQFFPGAETYRTDLKTPGGKRAAIESRLGVRLDPDESEFKFYRIIQRGKPVGTILTHLGKGQYGAIEIVVAVNNDGTIRGVRIQRDREKARAALRSDAFLNQFVGKSVRDPLTVGTDIRPAEKGAEQSSETVAFSVRKLLILHQEL